MYITFDQLWYFHRVLVNKQYNIQNNPVQQFFSKTITAQSNNRFLNKKAAERRKEVEKNEDNTLMTEGRIT